MPLLTWSWFIENLFRLNLWIYYHLPAPLNVPFIIIHQTRHIHVHGIHPWATTLMLLFPLPWHFTNPPPLPVHGFDTEPGVFYRRHENILMLRNQVLFQARDTPMRALYRLYDAIGTQDETEIKHEATYIWSRHTWRLSEWPDPRDTEPDRYIVLAAIMEELVRAFNWRLSMGFIREAPRERRRTRAERRARIPQPLESTPDWTSMVPPARQRIVLLNQCARDKVDEEANAISDPPVTAFERHDILTFAGGLFFI
ncbi:hypothetical protein B0H11DRAFT_851731 [Mycena galericulata]|nr:hypothetical protein B0H11DRAFT_851731 [Mycena galericulata]